MSWLNTNFHFLRPGWLLLLIPLFLLVRWMLQAKTEQGEWRKVIAPDLLPHLLQGEPTQSILNPLKMLAVAWLLATLALAGPSWKKITAEVSRTARPVVVVVDMSYKMYSRDLSPSRLMRTRYKLLDLFRLRQQGASALVAYAASAHTVAPLTDDFHTLSNLVPALSPEIMPVQGDNPLSGIDQAIELLRQANGQQGVIVLMTDRVPESQLTRIADRIKTTGHALSVVGVGTEASGPVNLPGGGLLKDSRGNIVVSKLDESQLRRLAKLTGGQYNRMTLDESDLKRSLPSQDEVAQKTVIEGGYDQWMDAGVWLVLLLIPFALAGFRRGWFLALVLFLQSPSPAEALEWNTLWQNNDQQAAAKLDSGQADSAADQFSRPDWRAEALYQSGRFDESANAYEELGTADGYYNQGNALAQTGRYEDAIKAYDQALALEPEMEDAQSNRKIVEELKSQSPPPSSSNEKSDANDSEEENKEEQNSQEDSSNNHSEGQQSEPQSDGKKEDEQQPSPPQTPENQQPQDHDSDQQQREGSTEESENSEQQNDNSESLSNDSDEQKETQQPTSSNQENGGNEDATTPQQQFDYDEDQQVTTPEQQAIENWLNTIPDDPGGLLKRKFLQQYQNRQEQSW